MRKLVLASLLASVIASPAVANDRAAIETCVAKISISHEGKTFNLRLAEDFQLVVDPYGKVAVMLKKRIEADPRWAHARPEVKKCLG